MAKVKRQMGVQQVLLHPDPQTEAILRYLCEQSGKLYNNGIYFARQTFFKTGRLLTGKFDLDFEPTVAKTMVARSLPSTPAQQTLRSVIEAFKSFKGLRDLYFKGQRNINSLNPRSSAYFSDVVNLKYWPSIDAKPNVSDHSRFKPIAYPEQARQLSVPF
jgi:putative transposase